jgi:hypothetical protein
MRLTTSISAHNALVHQCTAAKAHPNLLSATMSRLLISSGKRGKPQNMNQTGIIRE